MQQLQFNFQKLSPKDQQKPLRRDVMNFSVEFRNKVNDSGVQRKDIAKYCGMSTYRLRKIVDGAGYQGSLEELKLIALACKFKLEV